MKFERMRASTVPCRFGHRCGRRFGRPSFGIWFAIYLGVTVGLACILYTVTLVYGESTVQFGGYR